VSIRGIADKLVARVFRRSARFLSPAALEALTVQEISRRAASLPPDEALRLLFNIDAALYLEEGRHSVRYDGGIHTKHRHMRYHDFFVERIRRDERILDFGCGIGAVAYDVAERAGAHVVGIDANERALRQAREQHGHPRVEYREADSLEKLPDGGFDAVILSNVLEHLPDRPAFLRDLFDRSGAGRLLVRVPLFERDWRVPLKRELGVEWRLDRGHETEYLVSDFHAEMAAAELTVTHIEIRWGEIWAEAAPVRRR
jgi:SAM-dependent methyltransferase